MRTLRLRLLLATIFCFTQLSWLAAATNEAQLIAVLQSNASLREKDAACVQLKRVGSERCIPAVSALLVDEQLSHSARLVLESMPSTKADAALVEALEKTSGPTRVGIINSLSVRSESTAAPALARFLTESSGASDEQTQVAAAAALGQIATPIAIEALQGASRKLSGSVHAAVVDALLRSSDRRRQLGDDTSAFAICREIYETEKSDSVRMTAYAGMIRSSKEKGLALLTQALRGDSGPAQTAAVKLVSEVRFPGAAQALVKLLPELAPSLQVGIIEGLVQRQEVEAAPAIARLAGTDSLEVRTAAINAMGELGNDSMVLLLAKAAVSSQGEEQAAARRALVRLHRGNPNKAMLAEISRATPTIQTELAHALRQRGDSGALSKFLELARDDSETVRRAAFEAISGLADQRHVPALVKIVIEGKSQAAQSEAVEALGTILQRVQSRNGRVEVTPVVRALKEQPPAGRIALLPVCSAVVDPALRAALQSAARDSDVNVRGAAIRALCETHDLELLPDLLNVAHTASEENFRALATAGCVRLVTQEEGSKLSSAQRLAPLKEILAAKPSPAQKRMLLAGLAEIPDVQALALTEPMLEDPDVGAEAARAVIKIAPAISGAEAQASIALKKVLATATNPSIREAAQTALKTVQAPTEFITTWQVAGPYRQTGKTYADLFEIVFPPEKNLTDPASNNKGSSSATIEWKPLPPRTDPSHPAVLDLLKALGGEQCVAYVRTRINSTKSQPARLEIGSDDGIKVWLNGRLVHANNVARPLQPGSDKVDVNLESGWNDLVLKITQNNLGWEFCVRLLQRDGSHLDGLQFAAAP